MIGFAIRGIVENLKNNLNEYLQKNSEEYFSTLSNDPGL
jgi:hypothetical protein